jgi:hypothetical protein
LQYVVVVLVVGLLVVLGVTANAAAGCLTIGMVVVELELDMAGAVCGASD